MGDGQGLVRIHCGYLPREQVGQTSLIPHRLTLCVSEKNSSQTKTAHSLLVTLMVVYDLELVQYSKRKPKKSIEDKWSRGTL